MGAELGRSFSSEFDQTKLVILKGAVGNLPGSNLMICTFPFGCTFPLCTFRLLLISGTASPTTFKEETPHY